MKVRTRFAPSPTGYLHIGGLRTALYNYLFARRHGGMFVLRIEDTDSERYVPGAKEHLIEILQQVGLKYDEGPGKGGQFAPYIQSERSKNYQEHARLLVEKGHAYYCFCSSERLETLRIQQKEQKTISKYDRTCLLLSQKERDERLKRGEVAVIRLRMPDNKTITFEDVIRGTISISSNEVDDQVLLKSDGMPTYHLANVVDDHGMEITHVIRGEEWIPSTPKHVVLYNAFGWKAPVFAHLPLLLNTNKTKLSKRQGDASVEDYLAQGYLPQALLNFIALLGWNPRGDRERYTLEELIELFDLTKVNKAGAVLNKEKLDWLNHEYLLDLTDKEFAAHAEPFLKAKAYIFPVDFKNYAQWIRIEKQRIKKMSEVGEETRCLFVEPVLKDRALLIWKKSTPEKTALLLEKLELFFDMLPEHDILDAQKLEECVKQWIAENNFERGDVLWPLRVAFSGSERSPGPFELAALLGKKVVYNRIHNARKLF